MNPSDVNRIVLDASFNPIKQFSAPRLTRKEQVLKKEIETYRVNDVDETAVIYVGNSALPIFRSVELPDAQCDGLTYKQRVVSTEKGDCLLLARWKPDRYMRRAAPAWSQKWFVEKKLFPGDADRFFEKLEKTAETEAQAEER
ncbi:MAG: hypothetical protein ACE149_01930 [Armatimonadota bacterium]